MDWSQKYPWLSLLLGCALLFVWGVTSLVDAYDRSLATVNDSFTQGFMFMDRLGVVVGALARLSVDQEAFLSTGDDRFQDGVIESAETLVLDMDMLNSIAPRNESRLNLMTNLSRSVEQILGSVGRSDEMLGKRGRAAAVSFFESEQDAISTAELQGNQLIGEISGRISDRIGSARGTAALLHGLLNGAPAGTALGHGASLSNSARMPGRTGTVHHAWAHS